MEFELFKYGAAFRTGEDVDENSLDSFMKFSIITPVSW